MSELKRTQLYETHVAAGASMVDFGGWEMPVQYPTGIVAEHLYTRHFCSLFDVSHMGRLLIQGPERLAFLQHVLSSNVAGLDLNMAQYCILPDEDGGAVDDAYLYRFEEERLLLVVNAANTEKDLMHLRSVVKDYDCTITEYVQQRRMSQAEYLLAYTELTVGQVAQTVGYSTSSRFAELFRKSTGLLPLEYRKNAQRK